jgi:uncharacterized protein (DUF362 family)
VTEAITRIVLELGPKVVVIGEGSAAGHDLPGANTEEAFEASGTAEVARKLGVELRNLNRDQHSEVRIRNPLVMETVRIARTVLESDVVISVPVLKTHVRTTVTLALKNMKGVIPGAEKRKTHLLGLDKGIVDLNSAVCPHYALIDGVAGMEGLWQYPQDRKQLGVIVAGASALAVDVVGCVLMGFEPRQVLHLRYMGERQGLSGLEQIEVVGENITKHITHFRGAFQAFEERYPEVFVQQGESACTGCTTELVSALRYLKAAGYALEMEGLHIVIGNPDEVSVGHKVAVLGKCAREYQGLGAFAAGCPPTEESVIRALSQACGANADAVVEMRDKNRREVWETSNRML